MGEKLLNRPGLHRGELLLRPRRNTQESDASNLLAGHESLYALCLVLVLACVLTRASIGLSNKCHTVFVSGFPGITTFCSPVDCGT